MPSREDYSHSTEKYNDLGQSTPLTPGALSSALLPPPVLQNSSLSGGRSNKTRKSARINGGFRLRIDKIFRRLTAGTAPSTSTNLDESVGESSGYNRSRITGTTLVEDLDEPVDEVVVDREWSVEIKSSSITHSEHGGSPEKSGGSNHVGGTNTDHDSAIHHVEGFWGMSTPLTYLRWRIWPSVRSFFWSTFLDEKSEQHYRKENWFLRKNLAIWSASFFVLNWTLAIGLIPKPVVRADQVFYYAISPVLTFPILPMVMFDWPRDRSLIYQITLMCSTGMWGYYQLIFMNLCGKYGNHGLYSDCGNKDFLTTFYYTSALQTIGLFGLNLQRFPAMCAALVFLGLSLGLIVPLKPLFLRNVVNFIFFQAFLLYLHFMRETAERRLYTLRDQLKVQFRATQKAQVNERKAADSKRRLTSVVQGVRVPLNTALLAVQNMEASGALPKGQDIEFNALEGSLNMMSKVLNDVLDFNRMDSGRFESVLKPYAFHQVLRSLFIPLKLATDARQLEFVTDLDKTIDDVARHSFYEATGESKEKIAKRLLENPDEDGIVVGDETRLRQIITNLASNACKFTPAGGRLTIKTKLIIPSPVKSDFEDVEIPSTGETSSSATPPEQNGESDHQALSMKRLRQHDVLHSKPPPPVEWIVVRIEIADTGCGIRPKDMVQSKLFSAFNQTEAGRQQGGKGTGLGLALVRQIVKLSGGRLGVQSKVNEGSIFWVELPLGVGQKTMNALLNASSNLDTEENLKLAVRLRSNARAGKSVTVTDLAPSGRRNPPRHSALHNVMEQGGLVEISTKRGEGAVVTRQIGDPSTGTDATPEEACSSPSPSISEKQLQSNIPSASQPVASGPSSVTVSTAPSTETVKPSHLQLPKPQRFSLDDPIPDVSPAASSSTQPGSVVSSGPPASTHGSNQFDTGMKVLVVDDDPLTRKLMSRMLTRLGCKVWTAENGDVAVELILGNLVRSTPSSEDTGSAGLSLASTPGDEEKDRFAVVFLDNQMPVMSGLEAVAKLRSMGKRDFIVGVTGNALLTDQQEYLEAGVDHVLTKPVYEKSLKSMLAIADDRRKRGTPHSEKPPASPFVPA
ncbi:hypothetical protein EIP91_011791 [Steccherinum ochraceum]|uniref:histidine kinase n=1 Tax=Steccherinum ochraceum TaxID=92696 RepID=A0A4V2MWX5_9APHY|nr:hypothetical protein EIP91_011791 [Steccherinum ochraceum]